MVVRLEYREEMRYGIPIFNKRIVEIVQNQAFGSYLRDFGICCVPPQKGLGKSCKISQTHKKPQTQAPYSIQLSGIFDANNKTFEKMFKRAAIVETNLFQNLGSNEFRSRTNELNPSSYLENFDRK